MGKKRAKEHYDFIREQYHKEIDNTSIYACESVETRELRSPEIVAELFMEVKGRYNIRRSWVI